MTPNLPPPGDSSTGGPRPLALGLVILFMLLTGLLVNFSVRPDYGPDEPDHVAYVHVLATEGRLPTPAESIMVQHPPPFYALLAPVWRLAGVQQSPLALTPGPDALAQMTPEAVRGRHLLRVFSTILACLTLLVLARLIAVAGAPPGWQMYLLLMVAGWPMFEYMSGVVNNENLAILYSAVAALVLVSRVRVGTCTLRQAALLGILIGVGVWVKQTTLFVVPVAVWTVWAIGEPKQRLPRLGAFALAGLLAGCGWPLRNHAITGQWFPHYAAVQHQAEVTAGVLANPLTLLSWTKLMLQTGFLPDWADLLLPPVLAVIVSVSLAVALIACFVVGLRDHSDPVARRLRGMSMAALLTLVAALLQYAAFSDWRVQIGGRYLLNGIPWVLTLLSASFGLLRHSGKPSVRPSLLAWLAPVLLILFDLNWWYSVFLYYSDPKFGHG